MDLLAMCGGWMPLQRYEFFHIVGSSGPLGVLGWLTVLSVPLFALECVTGVGNSHD